MYEKCKEKIAYSYMQLFLKNKSLAEYETFLKVGGINTNFSSSVCVMCLCLETLVSSCF